MASTTKALMIYGKVPNHALVLTTWSSNTKFESVADGLSNTFLAGEWTRRQSHAAPAYNGDHCAGTYAGPPPDPTGNLYDNSYPTRSPLPDRPKAPDSAAIIRACASSSSGTEACTPCR